MTSNPSASAYFWIAADWFSSEYCWCSVDLRRYWAAGISRLAVMVSSCERTSTGLEKTLVADISATVTKSQHAGNLSTPEMLNLGTATVLLKESLAFDRFSGNPFGGVSL